MAQALVARIQRALTSSGLRSHFVIVLASVIVPLAIFGVLAWQDRLRVVQRAQGSVDQEADILGEHMIKSFEGTSLIMRLVDERIQSMSWEDIADSHALHDYLLKLADDSPEVDAIWLVDGDGVLRSSSRVFPMPVIRPLREPDFLAEARRTEELLIGRRAENPDSLYTDQIKGSHFQFVRRRSSRDGRYDGAIVLSITPSYFEDMWKASDNRAGKLMLLASTKLDVLARVPPARNADHLDPQGFIAAAISSNSSSGSYRTTSSLDGIDRIYSYRRVGPYPAYIAYGASMSSVLATWYAHLVVYGGIIGVAAFALMVLSIVAAQRMRSERAAVAHWRIATQNLAAETENSRLARKKLFEAKKLKDLGQLTGSFAHDSGNVLMAIQMNLELLRGCTVSESSEATLRDTIAEIERCGEMIRSLLIFARGRPLETEIVDVSKRIGEIAGLLHQAIGAHASFNLSVGRDIWPVNINENELDLALLNIAVNAGAAMPDGGLLRVVIRNVSLPGSPDGLTGEFVEISLSDTGCGMPPEVAAKAVEPFFTTKEEGKGTGLGLTQVYGFAKSCGGTMTLESEVNAGTTVTIYIPKHAAAADQAALSDRTGSSATGAFGRVA